MKVTAIQTKAYRMKDMLLDVIDEDEIITCKEIARRVGLKFNDIKFAVIKLVEWELLCEKRGGKYLFTINLKNIISRSFIIQCQTLKY